MILADGPPKEDWLFACEDIPGTCRENNNGEYTWTDKDGSSGSAHVGDQENKSLGYGGTTYLGTSASPAEPMPRSWYSSTDKGDSDALFNCSTQSIVPASSQSTA